MAIATSKPVSRGIYEIGDAHNSGVSWDAVFAGAIIAVILTVLLLVLGVGLGFSSISPWGDKGISAEAIGVSTLVWLALTQLAASSVGGYMAGRLRVKWASVHVDEVYFRDTAHGLLAWSVATLFTFTVILGTAQSVLGGALNVTKGAASTAISTINSQKDSHKMTNGLNYYADVILRVDNPVATDNSKATKLPEINVNDSRSEMTRGEVTRILVTSTLNNELLPQDREYLASIVANRNGITTAEAEAKVDEVYSRITKAKEEAITKAKVAAEKARKLATHTTLWLFVDLLLGAFFASLFATFGGRLRDDKKIYLA